MSVVCVDFSGNVDMRQPGAPTHKLMRPGHPVMYVCWNVLSQSVRTCLFFSRRDNELV